MYKFTITFVFSLFISLVFSQGKTINVLFLGNSYTYVNDLPKTLADVALSNGDTVHYDSNCPGGYTLQGHSTNATSLGKIAQGKWDFVVLQEQSQFPSFPLSQVETDVFPYAHVLDSLIHVSNPCTETVFYMTWGRKNGDASNCGSWPPVCTYIGMDSLLRLRYEMMATDNKALLSPVGAVWRYIRTNSPLTELYQADESHPTEAGTYAAACSFYSVLFRRSPAALTYEGNLASKDAVAIKTAAKTVVFDQLLQWHVGAYHPSSSFIYTATSTTQIQFTNTSTNASNFQWLFGDGTTSNGQNPLHTFAGSGTYKVTLIAADCAQTDTFSQQINIGNTAITNISKAAPLCIFPNPANTTVQWVSASEHFLSYAIYDALGRMVKSGYLNGTENSIFVEDLTCGCYTLKVQNSKNEWFIAPFLKSAF